MQDLFDLLVTFAFFAIAAWYVKGLDNLKGGNPDE